MLFYIIEYYYHLLFLSLLFVFMDYNKKSAVFQGFCQFFKALLNVCLAMLAS